MAGILIYSEKSNLTLELLTAAQQIAAQEKKDIKALTINDPDQTQQIVKRGIDCYQVENSELNMIDSAAAASALCEAAKKIDVDTILLSSDRRGKEVAGRLAQALNAGCLTDVKGFTVLDGRTACIRNALGGATIAAQAIKSAYRKIAVSPRAFVQTGEMSKGSLVKLELEARKSRIKLIASHSKSGETVDIEAAQTLVVVGQGLEDREDLPKAEKLAQVLGGEIACSKPVATDKKWFAEERIIGLSGKICKPELAIILGVSGQVQFTVGIRDAKTIVSINSDDNAGMNQMADYVLVGDIKEVLPELLAALE
ncbi:MAG: electron transfer flavoprotein subunit alpha/FixB family protein [Syntrophomonadaceae bacterium]|nr:electron transfer flavoprotein subunit alpha/FixB family protein [Syntrophomonadaceae bacterium]